MASRPHVVPCHPPPASRREEGAARPPTVLIATSTRSTAVRVAMAFAELGCPVEAIAWFRGPLANTRAVRRLHRYDPARPLAALRRAIARARADLVVPCDDRAVGHLLALHRWLSTTGHHEEAAIIARSMGDMGVAQDMVSRAAFAALARKAGVRVPLTLTVDDPAQLRAALARVGLPAMLKVDDTWGGVGVARVHSLEEADRHFDQLSAPPGVLRAIGRLLVHRDPFWLGPWLRGARPRVNVQAFVPGRPANCVVACRQGEVLAITQAEVLRAYDPTGPAAVVRIVERPEMEVAARRLVARCRASGFRGFDFVIDDATDTLHLIEMNQRITSLGHLAFAGGRDPVGAWVAGHAGRDGPLRPPSTAAEVVAYFPQAWWLDPADPVLAAAHHDVPWSEPELVRDLVRAKPWYRGWLARHLSPPLTSAGVAFEAPARPNAVAIDTLLRDPVTDAA